MSDLPHPAAARQATLAGCGALLLWAFLALLARLAAGLPPFQLTAMAFACGGVVSLAVVALRGQLGALAQPPLAWAHGVGGLFGYHALYFAALSLAPAVEANLLNYTWPLLIVLFSSPILGLRLGAAHLAGAALGFAGCALLIGAEASFPPGAVPGFLAAFGCAIVWSLYSVTSKRMAAVPTEAVAGFCLASAVLAGLAHLILETTVMPDARQWVGALLLGLGPVGAAFFLWDVGMKRGDPRLLGTLAYAVPVASTLLLIAWGDGALSWRIVAATALVTAGGWIAARAEARRG
ncbi:MAG TPA: EamA family transporter [Acetobacteraceae bacterium]|nr:EamA family transporter [Acetobacteraceae bacterium]